MPELVAFECAARYGNFTKAGADLGMSRVAVSRYIRELEVLLGIPLFERDENSVRLTQEGRELYAGVSRGLEGLRLSIEAATHNPASETVSVSMTSAVHAFWLSPVLDAFRSANPMVRLRLTIVEQHQMAEVPNFDVAVRFGPRAPTGFSVEHLCDETIVPVCAPSYLQGRLAIDAEALPAEQLLDLGHPYLFATNWRHWFEVKRIPCGSFQPQLTFNLYSAYVHAALAGQGIALLGAPIAAEALRSRSLVEASAGEPLRSGAFYLIWRPGRVGSPIEALVNRLLKDRLSIGG